MPYSLWRMLQKQSHDAEVPAEGCTHAPTVDRHREHAWQTTIVTHQESPDPVPAMVKAERCRQTPSDRARGRKIG